MLLSLKTSLTYIMSFLTWRRATVSVLRQLSSDITQFLAGYCPISGANIQAWQLYLQRMYSQIFSNKKIARNIFDEVSLTRIMYSALLDYHNVLKRFYQGLCSRKRKKYFRGAIFRTSSRNRTCYSF